jgi:hypothetical protein
MMHGREKSDSAIVAGKPTNNAVLTAAESVERRAGPRGTRASKARTGHRTGAPVAQALERVRRVASVSPLSTQGGSRMPELGTYGSARGARGNSRPYRDRAANIG